MKPSTKALLYNFIGFFVIFLILRTSLAYFFELSRILLALLSGIGAILLSPKFAVVHEGTKSKILMKWIFFKGVKEVN